MRQMCYGLHHKGKTGSSYRIERQALPIAEMQKQRTRLMSIFRELKVKLLAYLNI